MIKFIFTLLFVSLCIACNDECEEMEYRCTTGDRLQVCNSDGEWSTVLDCDEYESLDDPTTKVICCDYDPKLKEPNCTLEEECDD